MIAPFIIRSATAADINAIVALVRAAVFETYAALIEKNGEPPKGDPSRWTRAIVAEKEETIIGVGLAADDFISDLWIDKEHRGASAGAILLAALEEQIKTQSHSSARLRVVADNKRARHFYRTHGWRETRTYPHERDGHLMINMEKRFL